jgi:aquaporin Z
MRRHWPEYLMEAAELATFMLSACAVVTLLEHPASAARQALPDPTLRRLLMGLAMGATGVAIVYSPFGQRSGAHFNPSLTLTFLRLGRVAPRDAAAYVVAQFAGGIAGVAIAAALLGDALADAAVNYAVTRPGPHGAAVAFVAEAAISFCLMAVVLIASNTPRLARWTGVFAGALVATWITVEAPLSGMSMNPARTLGSAFPAGSWTALWVYFTAPPLGMLAAAEAYVRVRGPGGVRCAKLHHENRTRCIFRCRY